MYPPMGQGDSRDNGVDHLGEDFREVKDRVDRELQEIYMPRYKVTLGLPYDTIGENLAFVRSLLKHSDETYRSNALSFLDTFCEPTREFVEQLEQYALKDPSKAVQATAVACLGKIRHRFKQFEITRFLLSLVEDERCDPIVRKYSYIVLLDSEHLADIDPIGIPDNVRFPEDVDWLYLNKLREQYGLT